MCNAEGTEHVSETLTGYVSREDLKNWADELLKSPWAENMIGVKGALTLVRDAAAGKIPSTLQLPSADVVQVVRCRDCEEFIRPIVGNYEKTGYGRCRRISNHGEEVTVPDAWYCGYGVKKEEKDT